MQFSLSERSCWVLTSFGMGLLECAHKFDIFSFEMFKELC